MTAYVTEPWYRKLQLGFMILLALVLGDKKTSKSVKDVGSK